MKQPPSLSEYHGKQEGHQEAELAANPNKNLTQYPAPQEVDAVLEIAANKSQPYSLQMGSQVNIAK